MKVYIFTKFMPFGSEDIIAVASSIKGGEKIVRKAYPHFTPSGDGHSYILDKNTKLLGRVAEWEVDGSAKPPTKRFG